MASWKTLIVSTVEARMPASTCSPRASDNRATCLNTRGAIVASKEQPDDRGWRRLRDTARAPGTTPEHEDCRVPGPGLASRCVRRVVLCLLALAVLVPSAAYARTQFRCDIDRIVRDRCCCQPKKAGPEGDAPIMKRECCRVIRHSARLQPPATVASAQLVAARCAARVAIASVLPRARELRARIVPRAQAPPPERTLFSQHCALLV